MSHSSLQRRVTRRIERAHIAVGPAFLERLVAYFDLLSRWNQRMNLTARVDTDEAIDRLLVEPVIASRFLPRGDFRLMDVGSGGGSPAIPMKLMAPAMRLWMVESKVRKSAFLREAVRQLELSDTLVESQRVEDLLLRPQLHESMDVVSIRAVRVDAELLRRLALLLRPEGEFFLFVGASSRVPAALEPFFTVLGRERLVDVLQSQLLRIGR
jgi:16S rRNA (guanine527-N7)-methyltransferase